MITRCAPIRRLALAALLGIALGCRPTPSSTSNAPTNAARLSEDGVSTLLLLANSAEAGYGEVILSRTTRPDVRELARRLATDHAALGVQLGEVVARLDLKPSDEPASVSFRERSLARRASLRAAPAQSADSTYVQLEIDTHHELLQMIDQQLAPSARRVELRDYLASFRPAVRAHLAHAEQVRATLLAR